MNKNRLLTIIIVLSALTVQAVQKTHAQTEAKFPVDSNYVARLSTSTHSIAFGATNILDTYLSPENYTGSELRYIYENTNFKENKKWGYLLTLDLSASIQQARSKKCDEIAAMLKFQYAKIRRIQTNIKGFNIYAGAQTLFNIGGLYNTRNGNNPAQARLGLSIGPIASADYAIRMPSFLSRKSKNAILRYKLSAPLLGLQFSPNYGQSYYELFTKGNYDRNVVPTTIVATPSLRHSLTVDVPIKKRLYRIGYLGDYDQASVNHLKYHSYTHALLLGIVL